MTGEMSGISIEWPLILRILLAFLWGWAYGWFIHFHKQGIIFERRLTFLATVLGLAVDFLIAFELSYWGVFAVVASSAVGIIALALAYGYPTDDPSFSSYKLKWALEDAITIAGELIDKLNRFLTDEQLEAATSVKISKMLARAYQLKNILRDARKGEYSQKNARG